MKSNTGITILIADDDDGHALLVQQCFENVNVHNPVIRFKNGREAWDFLSGPASGLEPGAAYLLLLDIRMPIMDGVEVLQRIKADPGLKSMPVIMLTTTDDPREINRCYELGCNNYLVKPVLFEDFVEIIKRLGLFLMIVKAPKIQA